MFLEDEEWNDDKVELPSPTVTAPKENTNPKSKVVGKKSLLRTLQALGSVPEWKCGERERGSDSETESPSVEHTKKRRKKRRRKRKHGETEEQVESTEISQKDTQNADPSKKRKKEKLEKKVKSKTTDTTKTTESAKTDKEPVEDLKKKLSRQQWKNRMKNKRKSKNKFRLKEEATKEEEERKYTDHNDNVSQNNQVEDVIKKKCKKEKLKSSEELKQRKAEDEVIKKKNHKEDSDLQESVTTKKSELNKKAQLKKEKLRRLLQETKGEVERLEEVDTEKELVNLEIPDASSSLRSRMEQRLESARFRYINEVLYSSTSKEARRMFIQDPQAFWVYHRGYSAQVQRWPNNPVDNIIQFIRQKPGSLVVADFGCGDCKIAKSVKNKVHSFDLVATCELVTACDMAKVPLKDSSVDIAVFCLSLMGTNLADFLKEANRVLKKGGFLKIAEVSSRFDNVRSFLTALSNLGFKLLSKDTENTHFYSFDFVKMGPAPENMKKFGLQLKPCVYKRR